MLTLSTLIKINIFIHLTLYHFYRQIASAYLKTNYKIAKFIMLSLFTQVSINDIGTDESNIMKKLNPKSSFLCLRQYIFLPCAKWKTVKLNLKMTWLIFESELQYGKEKASAGKPRRWGFYALSFLNFDHIWPHVLTISRNGIYGTYRINGIICIVWFTKSDRTD